MNVENESLDKKSEDEKEVFISQNNKGKKKNRKKGKETREQQ